MPGFLVGAVVLLLAVIAVDEALAVLALHRLLQELGIEKLPSRAGRADEGMGVRLNPAPGYRLVTWFEGRQRGRRCMVVVMKPWLGSKLQISVSPSL